MSNEPSRERRRTRLALCALATSMLAATSSADDPSCDERVPLGCNEVLEFPDRLICSLDYLMDLPGTVERRSGTGFLVSPHAVLTSGHVVFERRYENQAVFKKAQAFVIRPAACLSGFTQITQFGAVQFDLKVEVTDKYAKPSTTYPYKYDIGVVHFVCPFEEVRTYMPLCFGFESGEARLGGYPRHAPDDSSFAVLPDPSLDGSAWRAEGETDYEGGRVVKYTAKGSPGASGGPVMDFRDDGTVRAYAVNSTGFINLLGCDRSGGPWFNDKNRDLIRDWIRFEPTLEQRRQQQCPPPANDVIPWIGLFKLFLQNPDWWSDLDQLDLADPPMLPPSFPSNQQIMQVIEHGFYEFAIFELQPGDPESERLIQLLHAPGRPIFEQWMPGMPWEPFKQGFLTAQEGTILLGASMARNIGPLQPQPFEGPLFDAIPVSAPEIPDDLDSSDDPQEGEIDEQFDGIECPADINRDGTVDAADLGLLIGAWNTSDAAADINGDGTVDAADLGLLIGAWSACP